MSDSRRLVLIGAIAAALVFAAAGLAVLLIDTGSRTTGALGAGATGSQNPGMMGGGYGMMGGGYGMSGRGYGPSGTPESGSPNQPGQTATRGSQAVTLDVKTDAEHGKLGSDGNWHDAFLPADFTVHAGETVTVTVYNYDNEPHSFTSQSLGVNQTIPGGSAGTPSKTTFAFTAPPKPGSYQWWCVFPCDPWAMAHNGYMRGYVTVGA